MALLLNPAMRATSPPPVMEARRWLAHAPPSAEMPLINVSQAAPVEPPPEPLRAAMAEAVLNDPAAHLYGPVLGLLALREEVARQWSRDYGGTVAPDQVAITSGCNEAFAAAISTLAGAGDEVLLPTPWYFNHAMWLQMQGIRAVPVPPGPDMVPDVADAARAITPRTRAIVLVTPNNPTGAEYPAGAIAAFRDLARSAGLPLIVDETYRDFRGAEGAPHDLFADPDWDATLIHLYSFSKAFRLTGHRVGAMIAAPARLAEVEKFLDTVTICPAQIGQIGALWGLRNLGDWLAGERQEILSRRAAIEAGAAELEDWRLLGCGAYFAYLRHPFAMPSSEVAQRLVAEAAILCLPGTMFRPGGDADGRTELRVAFANIDAATIATLFTRLGALDWPRR